MTQITSHILDTSLGKPAHGVVISLLQLQGDEWVTLGSASTNEDGRVSGFFGNKETSNTEPLAAGTYKLHFALRDYYQKLDVQSFYPHADVAFDIAGDGQHYHVPLLLNPFGYSTYRGS